MVATHKLKRRLQIPFLGSCRSKATRLVEMVGLAREEVMEAMVATHWFNYQLQSPASGRLALGVWRPAVRVAMVLMEVMAAALES